MAKIIYVLSKTRLSTIVGHRLERICHRLEPDNIEARMPLVKTNAYTAYGIMNPVPSSILTKGNSILLGKLFLESDHWADCGSGPLDGTFALFRDNNDCFEVMSDVVGSRTIWYYFDDNLLLASTSQRAIIMFLGSFEFNERVIPWMLSTGYPGPVFSWDKRIKRVSVDTTICIDKKNWKLTVKTNPLKFSFYKMPRKEHRQLLLKSIEETFVSLNIDFTKWVLPLSGGYDSRGILCFLQKFGKNIEGLHTLTWTVPASIYETNNDAYIAKKLADYYQVPHKYYLMEKPDDSVETLINRFILLGEGRVDHLSGYMDGFKIWKRLYEEGVHGVIRGDEGFGMHMVSSQLTVRKNNGCVLCSDYSNLKDYKKYGFPTQELPQTFLQREDESLMMWRDRLYLEYRLPTILAGLSDLKLSYVEVINPLLSRRIIEQILKLPDHLRTEKVLYKDIIASECVKIPIASKVAIPTNENFFMENDIISLIREIIRSSEGRLVFPEDFLEFTLKDLLSTSTNKSTKSIILSFKNTIKRLFPPFILNLIRDNLLLPMDRNRVAFRVFTVIKMHTILHRDSEYLKN